MYLLLAMSNLGVGTHLKFFCIATGLSFRASNSRNWVYVCIVGIHHIRSSDMSGMQERFLHCFISTFTCFVYYMHSPWDEKIM